MVESDLLCTGYDLEFLKVTIQALPVNAQDSVAIFLVRRLQKTPKNILIKVCISNMGSFNTKFYYFRDRDLVYFISSDLFTPPPPLRRRASIYSHVSHQVLGVGGSRKPAREKKLKS